MWFVCLARALSVLFCRWLVCIRVLFLGIILIRVGAEVCGFCARRNGLWRANDEVQFPRMRTAVSAQRRAFTRVVRSSGACCRAQEVVTACGCVFTIRFEASNADCAKKKNTTWSCFNQLSN